MRTKGREVAFITHGGLTEFVLSKLHLLEKIGFLFLAHGVCPPINVANELSGRSEELRTLCLISADLECFLIAAAEIDLFGQKSDYLILIDKGLPLDFAEMKGSKTNRNIIFRTKSGETLRTFSIASGGVQFSVVENDVEYLCAPYYCAVVKQKDILFECSDKFCIKALK